MRRLIVPAAAAALIASPALAFAGPLGSDDGTLSVRHGRGLVSLNFNGAVFGRVARGRIVVDDPVGGDGTGADFWGCDSQNFPSDTKTVCAGENLRFRAIGGRYSILVKGTGVFLSAVGRGKVMLDGRGDHGSSDGSYALNGDDYQSLPNEPTVFPLEAPPGG
jgi:hypothetical protein